MKRFALITLLSLAGFCTLPALAADAPAPVKPATPPAAAPATMDNLGSSGKPCKNREGMGMGMMGMHGMKGGDGHPCASCDCKHHTEISERMRQLEKRVDALQMAIEMQMKR